MLLLSLRSSIKENEGKSQNSCFGVRLLRIVDTFVFYFLFAVLVDIN